MKKRIGSYEELKERKKGRKEERERKNIMRSKIRNKKE